MLTLLQQIARSATGILVVFGATLIVSAQETPAPANRLPWTQPAHPATAPQPRRMTSVDVYTYRERQYQPIFVFDPHTVPATASATPEDAVVQRFRAMAKEDYNAWLATWNPVTRAEFEQQQKTQGQSPESWTAQWRNVLARARISLVRRIDTGEFVIITYKILRSSSAAESKELHLALSKLGNQWFATNELRRDGLMLYAPWLTGKDSLELVAK